MDETQNRGPVDDDFMCQYGGRWLTWDAFLAARLDALMPRQPKRVWGKR